MSTFWSRALEAVLLLTLFGQHAVQAGMYFSVSDTEVLSVLAVQNAAGDYLDELPAGATVLHRVAWQTHEVVSGIASVTSSFEASYSNGAPVEKWTPVRLNLGETFGQHLTASGEQDSDNIPENLASAGVISGQLITISNSSEQNLTLILEYRADTTFELSQNAPSRADQVAGRYARAWSSPVWEGFYYFIDLAQVGNNYPNELNAEAGFSSLLQIDVATGETFEMVVESFIWGSYVYPTPEPSTIHLALFSLGALLITARPRWQVRPAFWQNRR